MQSKRLINVFMSEKDILRPEIQYKGLCVCVPLHIHILTTHTHTYIQTQGF